MNPGKRITSY